MDIPDKKDFREADLQKANLQKANLQGANLQEADFRGSNLCKARNLNIDQLSKVKTLYVAKLDNAISTLLKKQCYDLFKIII
jgi:BTB/POZ domain-containing protein KCTD9